MPIAQMNPIRLVSGFHRKSSFRHILSFSQSASRRWLSTRMTHAYFTDIIGYLGGFAHFNLGYLIAII
ncbi:hypothetical protein FKW77_006448 [Venturia effusa]|uniref:Uncharacterized protein n=1 Tax=Venturia effusa TaxID=50376 RepID=A0A517LHE6_9PEZI|nr:hypothetical protein FKW77_006448 [Venturia effusa]